MKINAPLILVAPLAAALAGLIGMFAFLMLNPPQGADGAASPAAVRASGEAQVGGPFTLVNQDGETVTDADFRGRPMLIYFGFTYCPDVCPFSLQIMDAALAQLDAEKASEFQPVLITVDPERDTPEALREYVSSPAFPEGLVGLTGSPEQVRAAADAYRVYFAKVENDGTQAEYLVDHSSLIYLMDREGRFVEVFPHGADPQRIAARLNEFLDNHPAS